MYADSGGGGMEFAATVTAPGCDGTRGLYQDKSSQINAIGFSDMILNGLQNGQAIRINCFGNMIMKVMIMMLAMFGSASINRRSDMSPLSSFGTFLNHITTELYQSRRRDCRFEKINASSSDNGGYAKDQDQRFVVGMVVVVLVLFSSSRSNIVTSIHYLLLLLE